MGQHGTTLDDRRETAAGLETVEYGTGRQAWDKTGWEAGQAQYCRRMHWIARYSAYAS
ncbi:hypothetical protein D3C76_1795410 [compost metagenome]